MRRARHVFLAGVADGIVRVRNKILAASRGKWEGAALTRVWFRVHRGQTSRAVFRFISRYFIYREVET